jgi:hypothetical protein
VLQGFRNDGFGEALNPGTSPDSLPGITIAGARNRHEAKHR